MRHDRPRSHDNRNTGENTGTEMENGRDETETRVAKTGPILLHNVRVHRNPEMLFLACSDAFSDEIMQYLCLPACPLSASYIGETTRYTGNRFSEIRRLCTVLCSVFDLLAVLRPVPDSLNKHQHSRARAVPWFQ